MIKPSLGIDVSKLDLSLSLLIDNKHYQTKIDNNQHGFKSFEKWIKKHNIQHVKACMEATGSYGRSFAHYLYNNQHDVHIVNPLCINAFAKSKLSRHKTDKVDSKLIAEFAQQNDLPLYSPREKNLQVLQDLYRCLQNLKHQAKQVQNYLENKKHLANSVCKAYARLAKSISKETIAVEAEINTLIDKTEDIKNKVTHMQTIPGIGKLTAVAILAEAPCLDNFTNARELAAYAGLTPKHKTSGTSVRGRSTISKMGSSTLRKALYFPAIVAKKHNPIFVKLNQKLASKGKPTKLILIAIMRKLLHIIFGVVKHNKPFDPNFCS